MFICTFYHTPVAFCDRGMFFLYYEGGVADATPPFFVRESQERRFRTSGSFGFGIFLFSFWAKFWEKVGYGIFPKKNMNDCVFLNRLRKKKSWAEESENTG